MEKSFRSAMFGFNKEDVSKFIYQQNKSYEKHLADKDAELEKANAALADALKNEENWKANREKVDVLKELANEFRVCADSFAEALETEKKDLSSVECSYRAVTEKCEELESFRDKANKFDSLATALSGIFGGVSPEKNEVESDADETDDGAAVRLALVHADEKREIAQKLNELAEQIASLLSDLTF